jgi:(E)-4-hydroxy-3-methylbut-2-enyl-diphosphate synthase
VDGRLFTTLKGETLVRDFLRILDEYVESRYGREAVPDAAGRGLVSAQPDRPQ